MILCGYSPFKAKTEKELKSKVCNSPLEFPKAEWDGITDEAKDLISKMLNKNYKRRISANEALNHEWV